jgi:hypothetical protein
MMDKQLQDAYYAYTIERARAGILDHSLDIALLEGKTVEEAIVAILREAGRLPEGWDDPAEQATTRGEPGRRVG